MKKLVALLLTLVLLCGGVSLANEITDTSAKKEAETNVTFTIGVDESYIVTIPPTANLKAADGTATGTMTIKISAPSFNNSGKAIAVYLTKSLHSFKLINGAESLVYTIAQNGKTLNIGDQVLLWNHANNGADVTTNLTLNTTYSANQMAGSYTDTLTFTVSVIDRP